MKRKLLAQDTPKICALSLLDCLSWPHNTPSYPSSLSSQILTAQFRQMEQELAEAMKLREEERQQWVEQTNVEVAALRTSLEDLEGERMREQSELVSLREAEHSSQDALQKEKMEVAKLETELALMKQTEVAPVQANLDVSERDRAEIARLETELASMREASVQANQDFLDRERSQVDKLERELASLKEEQEGAQKKGEILAEIWRHLQPLVLDNVQVAEENSLPADWSTLLDTVQTIGTRLVRLKDEHGESEQRCAELTHTMETLQGKSSQCVWLFILFIGVLIF